MLTFAQLCGLRLHRPGGTVAANGALSVSRCMRCDKEIMRQGGGLWRTTPPHSRIVWRKADMHEMSWPMQDVE